MGYIKSGLFISLDGVIEAPETWHFPYFDDEMGAAVGELMSGNDATLIGRNTYDEFAAYWPTADPDDPMTAVMNGARKYVVSNTLTDADLGELVGDHRRRRRRADRSSRPTPTSAPPAAPPWCAGCSSRAWSTSCTCWCTRSWSATARSSSSDGATVPLKLVSSTTFDTGVLHLVYAEPTADSRRSDH